MSDTDKHEAIKDLRERIGRVEVAVNQIVPQVQHAVAAVTKEVTEFIREIDRRALDAKSEESDWKMQHATAVANCNAKGETATEAKKIALAAKAIAEKAYQASVGVTPKGHGRTTTVAWSGLIAALIGFLTAAAVALQSWTAQHSPQSKAPMAGSRGTGE